MIAEKIAEHVNMAQSAKNWLTDRGCRVMQVSFFSRRPLIEITSPSVSLVTQASRISESFNGGTRSVWVANVEGCRVIWR
ncbi:hypothetical protein [Rahnella contaminans]|uniref:hypothetical protein n=1 Tax=Rahnella contaminans TaxID=2703882 RepID=UPI003C2D9CAA